MKTVFINGLMAERSIVLMRALCREFTVVRIGYQDMNDDPEITIHEPSEFVGEFDFTGNEDFTKHIIFEADILSRNLARDACISPLGPPEGWSLPKQKHLQMILPKVANLLAKVQIFRDFHAHQPVHMLISGADYSSHSRPVVLAARDLGVPTLDIEHGYFFNLMFSAFKPDQGYIPTIFSSDYVNLDNQLEISIMTDHLEPYPTISPQLLGLGTPAITVADEAPDQNTARKNLGLDDPRKQVLLLGSWIEARMAGSLLAGQFDTINLFKDLFAALARGGMAEKADLMIKLHPADCKPQVLPHVSACLMDLAQQVGLPPPTIYTDRLAEVLAAADAVLAISWTSVLWDAFLMDKPAVMLLPNYLTESFKPGWRQKGSIPLVEGVVRAAASADEAWQMVEDCLLPEHQVEFATRCRQVRTKYGLKDKSVEQKSRDIALWVVDYSKA